MNSTAEEKVGVDGILCLLCDDNHTEPDMGSMHDHLTDEHDLFTQVVRGVTVAND